MRKAVGLETPTLITCVTLAWGALLSCQTGPREIVVIPRTTAMLMYDAENAGAEFAARKYGVRIRYNAPERADDVRFQIELVERAVRNRPRGLILWPDEPSALIVPVERAIAAGVPTVVVGSALSLPPQQNLSFIVNDDEMTGRLAALRVSELLQGRGQVAIMGIDPQSLCSLAILSSFESVLEQRSPGITIVERRAAADNHSDSELVVIQVLLSHPEVNAIFGLDSGAADGAYLALKARSLTDRIKVVGVEQDTGTMNALRLHQIDSIVAKDAYQMGYRAVESIMVEQSRQPGMIKLAPMLITADNLDSAAAQRFVDWRGPHQ